MTTYLRGVGTYLPEHVLSNDDLARMNPSLNSDKIFEMTGVRSRRVAGKTETAADLGFCAAQNLLQSSKIDRSSIDAVLFCTQTPDYLMPASACLLQTKLQLPTTSAAFDFNLGCSGFIYGLWMASALIESRSAKNVLLIAADTCTKLCNIHDLKTVLLFGDAGGAALLSASSEGALGTIGPIQVGTDGRGANNLIIPAGGFRQPKNAETAIEHADERGNLRNAEQLFMNGAEIFSFTLKSVHSGIQKLLTHTSLNWSDVDLFVLHQANAFMLEKLRQKMEIPSERLPVTLEFTGNTSSASIPLVMEHCIEKSLFKPGKKSVLGGFGVGYSWGFGLMEWGVQDDAQSING